MPEMQLNQDGSIVPAAGGESMLLNMCHKLDAARSQLEEAEEHGVADVFSAHARYLAAGRPGGLNHNILNQLRSEAERVSALVPGESSIRVGPVLWTLTMRRYYGCSRRLDVDLVATLGGLYGRGWMEGGMAGE